MKRWVLLAVLALALFALGAGVGYTLRSGALAELPMPLPAHAAQRLLI